MTAGLHKYACDLTLDPNTAHTRLILSDENRTVTLVSEHQPYPDHPERFDGYNPQVLCGESLTGRCYWEAEWSGDYADISVTYKGNSRKGRICVFGWNDKSWSLLCCGNRFFVRHNNKGTEIPDVSSSSKRVGVYVDVSAGTLSFYSVSDTHTLTHLHTFNTTFTEPLYAGFGVDDYTSSVSLCDMKQRPERNNSDTHTTGFSQPKPSGIHPQLNWIKQVEEHCDLLLYMCSKDPLILHLYLFPVDDRAKEKVEKNEKSSYSIPYPRPGRPFRMNTTYILDVPGASIHPKEGITLTRETPPNFFRVKTHLENDLQMTLIREEDQEKVWTATIEKNDLDLIRPKRDEPRLNSEADKARYFDDHWPDLIQGVTNAQIIADKLCQQKLIHDEQYSEITQSLTSQESMRKICDIIRKHRDPVKAKFISILQEEKLYHF